MAHSPPDPNGNNAAEPIANRPPKTPRWVKVFGIIAIVVVLLFVAMMVIGGEHGPGRHSGDAGSQVAPSSVVEAFAQPEGGRR